MLDETRAGTAAAEQIRTQIVDRAATDPNVRIWIANGLSVPLTTADTWLQQPRWDLQFALMALDCLDLTVETAVTAGSLVSDARTLMLAAHDGQTDKVGRPYHTHPERAAAKVSKYGPMYEAAAFLHDVVEDTSVTRVDIQQRFGTRLARIVDALTKRRGEPAGTYYARVVQDPIADVVKEEGDMADNDDPERLATLAATDPETAARLTRKYTDGRAIMDRLRGGRVFHPTPSSARRAPHEL